MYLLFDKHAKCNIKEVLTLDDKQSCLDGSLVIRCRDGKFQYLSLESDEYGEVIPDLSGEIWNIFDELVS